jgi:predicted house-cleaning noncanonical NTP pyrophosphatase (MazG superfamily)
MAGEIEITPIDTENAAESAANLADIEKDDELLNKLKEEAKETSEDDLLNQLINNSNKC